MKGTALAAATPPATLVGAQSLLTSSPSAVLEAGSAFAVVPDSLRLRPHVSDLQTSDALGRLCAPGVSAIFLGEHHNAMQDHALQTALLTEIRRRQPGREIAVGLEAVQRRFQPVLDAYSAREISLEELKDATDWERRWTWSFEGYAPVFEAARVTGARLLALNVDSEDLALVELGGFRGLPPDRLARYIPAPEGFGQYSRTIAFKEYTDYVIRPSYALHARMGILRRTVTGQTLDADMPFRNFLSGRLLWDEAMGSAAANWVRDHPTGLLVGMIGSDHVKFGCGAAGRCARALKQGGLGGVRTVLLNPTCADTDSALLRPGFPLTALQLRYATAVGDGGPSVLGGDTASDSVEAFAMGQVRSIDETVLPLADMLWYSGKVTVQTLEGV